MSELTQEQRDANILAVVGQSIAILNGQTFETRRRAVVTLPIILGHRISPENLRDQPWGVVAACDNCGQIAKAQFTGATIEGRATTTLCPARERRPS